MKKPKTSDIPEKVKLLLWGKAAGRCQLCNKIVYEDYHTHEELNLAEHAHIIASSQKGPRGVPHLSKPLAKDVSNLMLLCREHHRKIDTKEYIEKYTPSLLKEIKRRHEERIELVTSFGEDQQSHVLLYGANISEQSNPVNFEAAARAMFPEKYPAERHPTIMHLTGNSLIDSRREFWTSERQNLSHHYLTALKPRIDRGEITHLSVFALAPIPLLIELGRLLTDKMPAEIYQLQREPAGWGWLDKSLPDFEYIVAPPTDQARKNIALLISFSGTILENDIFPILGRDTAVWHMTIEEPNNDFMKTKDQLSLFRKEFRKLLNRIKKRHGKDSVINLFPAIPVSVAIEIGRVWMPKADLPLVIYDRNRKNLEFINAFQLG